MGTHIVSSVKDVMTSAGTTARRRPSAVLLSITLILTSLNVVAATEPENASAQLEELKARGPHAALEINPAGKIVPRPQASRGLDTIAEKVAHSLNEGKVRGFWKVGDDLTVTLTKKGRKTAEEVAASMATTGCEGIKSIGADWTGFQVEFVLTCSPEEYERRINELMATDASSHRMPQAGGLAPPMTRPPTGDPAVISEDWNCILSIGATFGTFLSAAALLVLPWLGWIFFTAMWTGFSAIFLRVVVDTIQNCTQVVEVRVKRQVWVSQGPTVLPLAFAGPAFRIADDIVRGDEHDSIWVDQWRYCSRMWFGGYRYSKHGYNVPTSVHYSKC